MKLSERSIRIKELIGSQVDMGTFGLVELELQAFDKEIAELKNCNLQNVNASTSIECADGKHHFYEVYFVNSDKEPFELDCIKCLECGKVDADI